MTNIEMDDVGWMRALYAQWRETMKNRDACEDNTSLQTLRY